MRRLSYALAILLVGISAGAPIAGSQPTRPALSVQATQLHWTSVPGAKRYQVVAQSTTTHRTIKTETAALEAPAARFAKQTVTYRVHESSPVQGLGSNAVTVSWGSVEEGEHHEEEKPPTTSCFSKPQSCGYPSASTTGQQSCASLPKVGNVVLGAGATLSGKLVEGYVKVEGSNAKVLNSCVVKGGGFGDESIFLEKGVTGFVVENSTIHGRNETNEFVEEALTNDYSSGVATARNVNLYNCGECLHGEWHVYDSYVISNGGRSQTCGAGCVVHFEDIFYNGNGEGSITFEHDTLLNPEKQTAVAFGESSPCKTHLTVKNSLVGGGGYVFYPCANTSSVGTSTEAIEGNRFVRCDTKVMSDPAGGGGYVCSGGPDGFGYFPGGGWSQPANAIQASPSLPLGPGNVWDDTGEVLH